MSVMPKWNILQIKAEITSHPKPFTCSEVPEKWTILKYASPLAPETFEQK